MCVFSGVFMAFRQKIILISRIFSRKLLSASQSNSLADLSCLMTCAVFPDKPRDEETREGLCDTEMVSTGGTEETDEVWRVLHTQFMYTGCSSDFLLDHLLAGLSLWCLTENNNLTITFFFLRGTSVVFVWEAASCDFGSFQTGHCLLLLSIWNPTPLGKLFSHCSSLAYSCQFYCCFSHSLSSFHVQNCSLKWPHTNLQLRPLTGLFTFCRHLFKPCSYKGILTFKHFSRLGNEVEKTDDKTDYIQCCTDFQALFMNGVHNRP